MEMRHPSRCVCPDDSPGQQRPPAPSVSSSQGRWRPGDWGSETGRRQGPVRGRRAARSRSAIWRRCTSAGVAGATPREHLGHGRLRAHSPRVSRARLRRRRGRPRHVRPGGPEPACWEVRRLGFLGLSYPAGEVAAQDLFGRPPEQYELVGVQVGSWSPDERRQGLVVGGRCRVRLRGTSESFDLPFTHIWSFANGRVKDVLNTSEPSPVTPFRRKGASTRSMLVHGSRPSKTPSSSRVMLSLLEKRRTPAT